MWFIFPLEALVIPAIVGILGIFGLGGMWWRDNGGWVTAACSFGLGIVLSVPFVVGAVFAFIAASPDKSKGRKVEGTIWQITSVGCAALGIWVAFLFRESEHGVLTVIIMAAAMLLIEGLLLIIGNPMDDGHRTRGLVISVMSLITPIVLMMWSIGWNLSYVTKVQNSNIAYYEATIVSRPVVNTTLYSEPENNSHDHLADKAVGSFAEGDHLIPLGKTQHFDSSFFVTSDLKDWAEVQLEDGTSGWVYLEGMVPHYWRSSEAVSAQQDQIVQESFMKLLPESTREAAISFFEDHAFWYEAEYADE